MGEKIKIDPVIEKIVVGEIVKNAKDRIKSMGEYFFSGFDAKFENEIHKLLRNIVHSAEESIRNDTPTVWADSHTKEFETAFWNELDSRAHSGQYSEEFVELIRKREVEVKGIESSVETAEENKIGIAEDVVLKDIADEAEEEMIEVSPILISQPHREDRTDELRDLESADAYPDDLSIRSEEEFKRRKVSPEEKEKNLAKRIDETKLITNLDEVVGKGAANQFEQFLKSELQRESQRDLRLEQLDSELEKSREIYAKAKLDEEKSNRLRKLLGGSTKESEQLIEVKKNHEKILAAIVGLELGRKVKENSSFSREQQEAYRVEAKLKEILNLQDQFMKVKAESLGKKAEGLFKTFKSKISEAVKQNKLKIIAAALLGLSAITAIPIWQSSRKEHVTAPPVVTEPSRPQPSAPPEVFEKKEDILTFVLMEGDSFSVVLMKDLMEHGKTKKEALDTAVSMLEEYGKEHGKTMKQLGRAMVGAEMKVDRGKGKILTIKGLLPERKIKKVKVHKLEHKSEMKKGEPAQEKMNIDRENNEDNIISNYYNSGSSADESNKEQEKELDRLEDNIIADYYEGNAEYLKNIYGEVFKLGEGAKKKFKDEICDLRRALTGYAFPDATNFEHWTQLAKMTFKEVGEKLKNEPDLLKQFEEIIKRETSQTFALEPGEKETIGHWAVRAAEYETRQRI